MHCGPSFGMCCNAWIESQMIGYDSPLLYRRSSKHTMHCCSSTVIDSNNLVASVSYAVLSFASVVTCCHRQRCKRANLALFSKSNVSSHPDLLRVVSSPQRTLGYISALALDQVMMVVCWSGNIAWCRRSVPEDLKTRVVVKEIHSVHEATKTAYNQLRLTDAFWRCVRHELMYRRLPLCHVCGWFVCARACKLCWSISYFFRVM